MLRILFLIFIFSLLGSCATYRKVSLPDGSWAYIFKCKRKENCFKEARDACKNDYTIVEGSKIESEKISILVKCNN